MNKKITQERILAALDKASAYLDKKPEISIAQTLCSIGLKSTLGVTDTLDEKDRLELAYQGFTDPEQVLKRLSGHRIEEGLTSVEAIKKTWLTSFNCTLEKHWGRQEKIIAIQEKHGITGLELATVNMGEIALQYHEQNDRLKTLDNDFKVLESERIKVARAFCNAVKKYNMTLWVSEEDGWVQTNCKRVLAEALPRVLTTCWVHKYYLNQKDLETKGFATIKPEIESFHDKIRWEFHLSLADELYPSIESDSIWFCANLGDEKPSM